MRILQRLVLRRLLLLSRLPATSLLGASVCLVVLALSGCSKSTEPTSAGRGPKPSSSILEMSSSPPTAPLNGDDRQASERRPDVRSDTLPPQAGSYIYRMTYKAGDTARPAGTQRLTVEVAGQSALKMTWRTERSDSNAPASGKTENVRWDSSGAAKTSEVISIGSQDITCRYDPPLFLERFPIAVGDAYTQTSKPSSGCPATVKTRVVRQEAVRVGGATFKTWLLDVRSQSAGQPTQSSRWFAPDLGVDVKRIDSDGSREVRAELQKWPT